MARPFKIDDLAAPRFGSNYNVLEQVVLNMTNLNGNNNKYYTIELQEADGNYRVFTHYGRVGVTGTKEGRYFMKGGSDDSWKMAEKEFAAIIRSKEKKGYVRVEMAAADVGSGKANSSRASQASCALDARVQRFVEQVYEEASKSLSATIKTPLGALSEPQIDKGFQKLEQIRKAILYKDRRLLVELSSQFYSLIPQRFSGRINADIAVIDDDSKADRQEELLQLMKDV